MDFRDSPEEAAFRARLHTWLVEHNPGLPTSSTDDEYWARQGEWHTALYDAGFFGMSWPARYGGHDLPTVYDVILDDELAAAGAPPRPSLGYLVQGICTHGSDAIKDRFLPGLISGRERWCQGFSEPDAGSDLASLRTSATRDGNEYVIDGHKIWTSYSDVADWCLLLARTDPGRAGGEPGSAQEHVAKHKGLSAFAVPMRQAGIEQRPLRMINGITTEFGQVLFDGARVPAENMIGAPGEGWRLAMTIVSHEREPGELGYVARYAKTVKELEQAVRADPSAYRGDQRESVAWAYVQAEMLRLHVCRRLSERLDGVEHGPGGSIDKLLMTWVEQTVGSAALAVSGSRAAFDPEDEAFKVYLYSRAQSVMGGTSQIQKNIVAQRILGLPLAAR
jgi:alkylation response protein AidB-like acyl-CoA dehydrogenase